MYLNNSVMRCWDEERVEERDRDGWWMVRLDRASSNTETDWNEKKGDTYTHVYTVIFLVLYMC